MLRRASTSAFLLQIEASSARSRESLDTSCPRKAVRSCHAGGPSLLHTGEAGGGVGGTKGAKSPSSEAGSRLSSAGSFLGAGCTRGWSSPLSEITAAQGVSHLHLHTCRVHDLDMLFFALTWQRLHVYLSDQVAYATWSLADTQDSSSPTQYVPLWSTQLERNTDQKLDM